tara:strand:- start:320 stop:490 length:171 start_codon:yes stop_codon:yes gene_type:complete
LLVQAVLALPVRLMLPLVVPHLLLAARLLSLHMEVVAAHSLTALLKGLVVVEAEVR